MPNANYVKGVRKERKLVNEAKKRGCIAFRSAGSHSPIDVCIINTDNKFIFLVQAKPDNMTEPEKRKLRATLPEDGEYKVIFEVR